MEIRKLATVVAALAMGWSVGAAYSKLPPPTEEAKAKAEAAKAKAAEAAKKEAEALAKAQDRVAERYKREKGKGAAAIPAAKPPKK